MQHPPGEKGKTKAKKTRVGLQACGRARAHISCTREHERKSCVIIVLRASSGQFGLAYFLEMIIKKSCMLLSVVQL